MMGRQTRGIRSFVASNHLVRRLDAVLDTSWVHGELACPLKPKCCPKAPSRRIPRDIDEDARDLARSLVGTPEFEQSRRERKKVEMVFAHLKRIFGLGRLRLRGPRGAQDEFLLAATAQNLKKLARHVARPPPLAVACALSQQMTTDPRGEAAYAAAKLPREIRIWPKAVISFNYPRLI